MKIIVVGASLICAKGLRERGAEVVLFEASDAPTPGLSLAGEYTKDSSTNSSMLSGEVLGG